MTDYSHEIKLDGRRAFLIVRAFDSHERAARALVRGKRIMDRERVILMDRDYNGDGINDEAFVRLIVVAGFEKRRVVRAASQLGGEDTRLGPQPLSVIEWELDTDLAKHRAATVERKRSQHKPSRSPRGHGAPRRRPSGRG